MLRQGDRDRGPRRSAFASSALKLAQWIVIGLGSAVALQHLSSGLLVNLGMLSFQSAILAAEVDQIVYPHWNQETGTVSESRAAELINLALSIQPENDTGRWALGRVALFAGDALTASEALPVENASPAKNMLKFLDTTMARSRVGDSSGVIELYTSNTARSLGSADSYPAHVVTELVALAHLDLAQQYIEAGSLVQARNHLQNVVKIRPGDLFANYHLQLAPAPSEEKRLSSYLETLVYFPIESVSIQDERLLRYSLELVPNLIHDNIWDIGRSRNIIGYWIWKHPKSEALLHLLKSLLQEQPDNPHWAYYLSELYARRGAWEEAKTYFEIGENAQSQLSGAMTGPPMGTYSEAKTFDTVEYKQTSDDIVVAAVLGVSASEVQVGENLLDEVVCGTDRRGWTFQIDGGLKGWQYDAGIDSLERPGAVRIVNLWWPEPEDSANRQPYAYCHGPNLNTSAQWLVVSAWYRTTGGSTDRGRLFLGNPRGTVSDRFVQALLDNTGGTWTRVVIVGPIHDGLTSLEPLLVNAGASSIWFDDFSVRVLDLSGAPQNCLDEPCVQYFEQGH